jgi:squalene synthase HpnC
MVSITPLELETAYRQCEALAQDHYENFPVASLLLPKKLRRPIAVIYAFARLADDLADEGTHTQSERLNQLQYFWQSLENIQNQAILTDPLFMALQDVVKKHPTLPLSLFFDLLHAFQQDVVKKIYENFTEILDYCRHSANPIGRLLLHLTNQATEENLKESDAICTALQLINFLQDLQSDLIDRRRCYLPKDEMNHSNIKVEQFMACQETKAIQTFIQKQIERALQLLNEGSPLGKRLPGIFGFEIRLITACGYQMIKTLNTRRSVYVRPTIKFWHWPMLLWKALIA